MSSAQYLNSALLESAGFRHAFFTRQGGVSGGAFASLNFSVSVGDSERNVYENLLRAAQVLGVEVRHVYFLWQVHGRDVQRISGSQQVEDVSRLSGDALIGTESHIACGVRTADCVPILIGDCFSGAAAAVHAGWRGVVQGVVESALKSLRELGGGKAEFVAAIGPHISSAAFEVSEEVARELEGASNATETVDRSRAKPHVDLRRIVHAQLEQAGVAASNIDDVEGCTVRQPELFFSYRRDGKRSGRHLSCIVPALKSAG